jgi:soluble P-type ATPase
MVGGILVVEDGVGGCLTEESFNLVIPTAVSDELMTRCSDVGICEVQFNKI